MFSVKPKPANDIAIPSAQGVSYVVFAPPRFLTRQQLIIVAVILGALTFLVAVATFYAAWHQPETARSPAPPPARSAAELPKNAAPNVIAPPPSPEDGIAIDAAALSETPPPARVAALADKLPPAAMTLEIEKAATRENAVPAIVGDQDDLEAVSDRAEDASLQARRYLRQGQLELALKYQRQAAELAPHNLAAALGLAVICDHLGDRVEALANYRRVIAGYENYDDTLSRDAPIDEIRSRAGYLAATGADLTAQK